jgi:hypothetical protein
VAPCYRRFPVALRLKNDRHSEILETDADIRNWLPGDIIYDDAVFLPAGIPPGEYELAIGLLDPHTRRPKVKLAIEGRDNEGWHRLGILRVQ